MVVEVRGKKFTIDLVNNRVNRLYQEINDTSIEMTQITIDLQAITSKRAEEKRPFTEEELKTVEKMTKRVYEARDELRDKRWEIIKELIESNDIEYDEKFWDRKTGPEDLNQFMLECLDADRASFTGKKSKSKKK